MKRRLGHFLAVCGLAGLLTPLQAADPSSTFVTAYESYQTAEKLESKGNMAEAVEHYRRAEKLLKQLARTEPDWSPLVVQFRLKKTQESIGRLESQVSSSLATADDLEGPLPSSPPSSAFEGPPVRTGPGTAAEAAPRRSPGLAAPAEGGRAPLTAAEREARLLRDRLAATERDNENFRKRLLKATADMQSALIEVDRTKTTVAELKAKLVENSQALENAQQGGTVAEELRKDLQAVQKKQADIEADNAVLRDENERLLAKLDQAAVYIKTSDTIRDGLLKDRKDLSAALAGKNLVNPAEFNRLQGENAELKTKLAASEAGREQLTAQVTGLRQQLELANDEIARVKLSPDPSAEEKNLLAENELLRSIILRQLGDQARREEAIEQVEAELVRLNVHSEVLDGHLDVLAEPVVNLTAEERALFKEPMTLISESNPSSMQVVTAVAKPQGAPQGPRAVPSRKAPTPTGEMPESLRPVVEKAKAEFDRQEFGEAEKLYQLVVRAAPANHFILTNLGIVRLQLGKLDEAQASLERAAKLKPDDAVAYTYLGIVQDRQGNVDEAIALLQKSLQTDRANHIAHNYLGICLGKKGDTKAAEKEIKKAIELKPNYAPAYFNLAILYATGKPPSRSLAKQYYARATELGAAPDASLERLIQ